MTTVAPPRADVPLDLQRSSLSARRRVVDMVMKTLMWLAVIVAAIPLGAVTYYVISKGLSIMSWDFLFGQRIPRQPDAVGGSMGPAVVGTILTTGVAALIAIPLGVLGAIYLNEYGKTSTLARTIRTMADVMTGVPSVIMGLFIFLIFVVPYHDRTALAGALALACLMLPVVIRSSEEMLKLVPDELRQASLALGSRKWRTTLTVVLPAAISGITSGALLAIARAAGETAPIVLVVGITYRKSWELLAPNTSLPAQIFANATQPYEGAQQRGWGAALALVIIVLVTTLIARFISARFAIKER
jgi:phosphate transport system permease protein